MQVTKKQLNKFLNTRDFFKLFRESGQLPATSWLFVTHNRCPFAEPRKNPLIWAFQTLLNNRLYKVDDFVVVDDCSHDYTKSSIDWLRYKYNIKIKYIKNKKRISCSSSRKIGLEYTKNNLVFMGDDDCLYSSYFLVGSILTYQMLKKQKFKEKIAVINLPAYEKRFYPDSTVERKKIGKVMLEQNFFYHEFDKFPLEYISSPRYLDKYKLILQPIKVDTFKGVNLCDKELILSVGNYLDLAMWPSSYSEHIELSYKLQNRGFSIYHQPDPKISSLHLKYGNITRDKFDRRFYHKKISGLHYSLGQMVDLSQKKNINTGARLADELFHIIEVGSFFSFYLKISKKLGLKFAKKQYRLFVQQGKVFSSTPASFINDRSEREKIFFAGIKKGLVATEMQTGRNYQRLWGIITNELVRK